MNAKSDPFHSFPGSAWERTFPKHCFNTEAVLPESFVSGGAWDAREALRDGDEIKSASGRSRVLASLLHYLFFTLWMVEFPLSPGRSAPDPEIVGFGLVLRLHRGEQKTPAAGALTSRDGSIG